MTTVDRLTNSSGDRIGSEARLARETNNRYTEEDPASYSETYGTTLTKAQAKAFDDYNTKFNSEVDTANKTLSEQRSKVESLYSTDREAIDTALSTTPLDKDSWKAANENLGDSAYNDYLKGTDNYKTWNAEWMKENTIPVNMYRVDEGTKGGADRTLFLGTYYIPSSSAKSFKNNLKKLKRNDTYATISGGSMTVVAGSSGPFTQIKDALSSASSNLSNSLLNAYSEGISKARADINTKATELETTYSTTIGNLNLEQQKVQNAVSENTQYFTDLRAKYATKLANIKGTIGSMTYNG